MKKIISVLLTLVMLFAITSVCVFADETTMTTLSVADARTYEAYQIFVGDVEGKTLSNVKWGANGTGAADTPVDEATLTLLAGLTNTDISDESKLAVIESLVNLAILLVSELAGMDDLANSQPTVMVTVHIFQDIAVDTGKQIHYHSALITLHALELGVACKADITIGHSRDIAQNIGCSLEILLDCADILDRSILRDNLGDNRCVFLHGNFRRKMPIETRRILDDFQNVLVILG